jgi:hypothetical protein
VKIHLDFFIIFLKIEGINRNNIIITALVNSITIINFINETILNYLNNKDTKTYALSIRDARGRALALAFTLAN